MPVDTKHPLYTYYAPDWEKCRDTITGARAIKEKGEVYLPKLAEQTDPEYAKYKWRALFYNATGRTKEGLEGFIFRKDPETEAPDILADFQADSTLGDTSFYNLTKQTVGEVLDVGRFGTLIDWSMEEKRPYVVGYAAEDIINWRLVRVGGRMMLGLLVLKERVSDGPAEMNIKNGADEMKIADFFEDKCENQYRVYRLMFDAAGESYVQCEIYRGDGATDDATKTGNVSFVLTSTLVMARKGLPLSEIPFVFHSTKASACDPEKPPLLDVADVNVSHYVTSADLEHGRHFTGLPTAWVAGFPKETVLKIGSGTAWVSDNENAKAGFLEFTGQGLGCLENALKEKDARLLESQKLSAESGEAQKVRKSGETSVLANIANSLSESLSRVLQWAQWWYGTEESIDTIDATKTRTELNTDFTSQRLTPQELQQLVLAWQAGAISYDTLHGNLQKGEIVSADATAEDEQAKIEANPPPMGQPQAQEPALAAAA